MLQVPSVKVGGSAVEVVSTTIFNVPSTVTIGDMLYLTGVTDSADRADNTNAATMPAVAFCTAKPTPTTAIAMYLGEAAIFSGLTPGATQYVGLLGALTESAPITPNIAQKVGKAVNASTLLFHPKQLGLVGVGHAPWKQDEFVPTSGQTVFILSVTPSDPLSLEFHINGVLYDDSTDFTVSGTTATWLDPFVLGPIDKVIIRYQ